MDALNHHLWPLPEQSLLGFLLHADRVNGLPLGSVRAAVSTTSYTRWTRPAIYATARGLDLARLAELTSAPLEDVERTTFLPELRALLETPDPAIQTLGQMVFRLCPRCWSEAIGHRRDSLLSPIVGCPAHAVRLTDRCACGAPLGLSIDALGACAVCRLRWGELPAQALDERESETNARVLRAYGRVLKLGVPLRAVATRPLRRHLTAQRRERRVELPVVDMRTVSVERLVAITALIETDPDLVAELLLPKSDPCPNASCPRFTPDPWEFRNVEKHCPVCGSRFCGPRLLSTFDVDHGQSRPLPSRVNRARRRLARWRRALRRSCEEIASGGREVTVTEAFRRAGIPMNANLRASRLGLTAIVRSSEARRRAATGPWRFVLQGQLRNAATKPDLPWLNAWWFRDGARYLPPALQQSPRQRATRASRWN